MKTLKTSKAIVKLAILACLIFSLQLAQSAETGVDGDTLPLVDEALSKTDEALSGGEEALSEEAEPTHGEKLYFKKGCDVCHGYVGQGWLGGKRLAEPVLPLAAFKTLVRRPNGSMPPFSPTVLSESELEAIHEYLASLKSPDAKDIPLLQLDN